MRSPGITAVIDMQRIRANLGAIRRTTGVEVWAVVKADAYGLGAARVTAAIAEGVDGFCVFSLAEARTTDLWRRTRKPTIALGPPESGAEVEYRRRHVRPAVTTVAAATALRRARPLVCVDTGMQRFACPLAEVAAVVAAGSCDEAFTHATRVEHVALLAAAVAGAGRLRLHAAASSLLDEPRARLDAVRPGLALYRGAVRVAGRLVECRDASGPAGYGGFRARRHGVIMAGYAHGLRCGPCLIAGRRQRILEVGMQTAFVSVAAGDRIGDEVVLLGDGLDLDKIAPVWKASPHEVLVRFAGMGRRRYRGD